MGADGGVAFIRMVNPVPMLVIRQLLLPWYESLFRLEGGMSFADDSRFEWISHHSKSEYLYGGYGLYRKSFLA